MKNETQKEIKYHQINIGDKYQVQAYIHFTKAISYIAEQGNKSPLCWLLSYKILPHESHSAFAHQECALLNPELNYIQDGFIFCAGKRIAIKITDYTPVYDAEILLDWRNNNGHYKLKKAIILPLDVIETLLNDASFAQSYHDYIHLGHTLDKPIRYNSPCIGIDGRFFNSITHTMRADARTHHIQGQDSIAFHLRSIKRINKAIEAHSENGGHI
ncbi:hypothetical protein ACX1NX_02485 [Acinetobacter sp. ANC 5383]